ARLAAAARAAVSAMPPGSGLQLAWARAYASAARSPQELAELRRWLDGVDVPEGLRIDTELRWLLLQALVAGGAAGDAEIDAELGAVGTASGGGEAGVARVVRPAP